MPLTNRVDPWGRLVYNPSKAGRLFGNRGILHDENKNIVRQWVGKAWVACDPKFKGIDRRPLFQPGRYSELFFLDEATAFAAGHRPCGYCRKERLNQFKAAWANAHPTGRVGGQLCVSTIDSQLHADRTSRGASKQTYLAPVDGLPEGTIIDIAGNAYLIHCGQLLRWSFAGYTREPPASRPPEVVVLTPRSIVEVYMTGFAPGVHESACA